MHFFFCSFEKIITSFPLYLICSCNEVIGAETNFQEMVKGIDLKVASSLSASSKSTETEQVMTYYFFHLLQPFRLRKPSISIETNCIDCFRKGCVKKFGNWVFNRTEGKSARLTAGFATYQFLLEGFIGPQLQKGRWPLSKLAEDIVWPIYCLNAFFSLYLQAPGLLW